MSVLNGTGHVANTAPHTHVDIRGCPALLPYPTPVAACRLSACRLWTLPPSGVRVPLGSSAEGDPAPAAAKEAFGYVTVAMRFFLSPRVLLRGSLARKLSAVVALLRTPATPHRIVDAIPCAPAPYYGPRRPRHPRPGQGGEPASTCLRAPNAAQRHSRGCGAT